MSLEEALAANTAAIVAQTEFMKSMSGKAASTTTASTGPKTTAKTTAKATTKVTEEELRKTATAFLTTTDASERDSRKAWVGKINEHFGVTKISEAPADKWADVVRMLKQLSAGETPPELASEDAGEEEESMI